MLRQWSPGDGADGDEDWVPRHPGQTPCLQVQPPTTRSVCLLVVCLHSLHKSCMGCNVCLVCTFDDHLYSAILRSLEQTHCARLWFYMSDKLFFYSAFFEYPPKWCT